ncbi:MAG: DUF4147 domain-containing protein [Leptospira sp.]|nr:DUF4147 domain-containing protein [Leptospira sp.]
MILRDEALKIFLAGLDVANPSQLLASYFSLNPDLFNKIESYNKLNNKIFVFSLGKAAFFMAKSFFEIFPNSEGFVFTKEDHLVKEDPFYHIKNWIFREGTHPIVSELNVQVTHEVILWTKKLKPGDLFVTLLSGGGSALFEIPILGLSIEELIKIHLKLLNSSLSINEINEERKKISSVKGGQFLQYLPEDTSLMTLALSDVIGDDPNTIASAPTYPGSEYHIIGNLKKSLLASRDKAIQLGYHTIVLSDKWNQDAKETGKILSQWCLENKWDITSVKEDKIAIIIGGEMVTKVLGNGIGGRNQEATLSFAIWAHKLKLKNVTFLSAGTDGTDGPTDVAGACVSEETYLQLVKAGIDPLKELDMSNSFYALNKISAHIKTGPTGTNVNDILILLISDL